MAPPLAHLRVLDLSRILAGPWATQILADLGAEVIKVERPGAGDDTRQWGPPFLKDGAGHETSEAAYFLSTNRGKKSLTLNLADPLGAGIVRALAAKSDVLVENYKVGGLAKYGLGWDDLKVVNPRLIYCSITGFGQDGPYRHRAGYDFMIQAMGGMMSITGERDDLGGGPQKVGVAVADLATGLYATIGVLAALNHRERTGEGQHVDMALLDSLVALLANQNLNYLTSGKAPGRYGNAHANLVPYQAFETADDPVIVAVGNDEQYRKLCGLMEAPELATDERFNSMPQRIRNRDVLVPLIAARIKRKPRAFWLEGLEKLGVPTGPINRIDQVFDDPQVKARGMRLDLDHPLAGHVPTVRSPIRLSATPPEHRRPPPTLGQHSDEVLRDLLDMDARAIADLRAAGVL
ncbi:MAG: CoA transferase [Alphaproteobacteria bacterium]|nr:CoA transferase [Alphaproteobacteria bacterium]